MQRNAQKRGRNSGACRADFSKRHKARTAGRTPRFFSVDPDISRSFNKNRACGRRYCLQNGGHACADCAGSARFYFRARAVGQNNAYKAVGTGDMRQLPVYKGNCRCAERATRGDYRLKAHARGLRAFLYGLCNACGKPYPHGSACSGICKKVYRGG